MIDRIALSGNWEVYVVPSMAGEDVLMLSVFCRSVLSSLFRKSSVVIVDIRPSELQKSLRFRISCVLCRGNVGNRMMCVHESNAVQYLQNIELNSSTVTSNEGTLVRDETINIAAPDGDLGEVPSSSEENGNLRTGDVPTPYELAKDDISFVSPLPRFFFPCESDERTLEKLMSSITTNDSCHPFLGIDPKMACSSCGMTISTNSATNFIKKEALLHTLHHGSVRIVVADLHCVNCKRYIPYDGSADALFRLTDKHVLTRELLDAWMWDICGRGGTFRDAFSSWHSKVVSTSAKFHRIGSETTLNRQRGNEAFSAFLMTLEFPNEADMDNLFSCDTCEKLLPNGEMQMDGVVMDGTAMGILGTLPTFVRPNSVLLPVSSVADRQYIMRSPKLRQFVESISGRFITILREA